MKVQTGGRFDLHLYTNRVKNCLPIMTWQPPYLSSFFSAKNEDECEHNLVHFQAFKVLGVFEELWVMAGAM